jgi:hypothetical protein
LTAVSLVVLVLARLREGLEQAVRIPIEAEEEKLASP